MSIKQSRQVSQAYIDKGNDIELSIIADWEYRSRINIKKAMKRQEEDRKKGINNPLSFYAKVYARYVFDTCNDFIEKVKEL